MITSRSKASFFPTGLVFCLLFACGVESPQDEPEAFDHWEGNQSGFEEGFVFRKDGNQSVLRVKGAAVPFSGRVERNSTRGITSQRFSDGKLEGKSIKKSPDGSWVEAHYRNGRLHGKMTFHSPDGTVRSVLRYEDGRLLTGPEDGKED